VHLKGTLAAYADSSGGGRQAVVQVSWPESMPPLGARADLNATVNHQANALLVPSRAVTANVDRRTVELVENGQRRIVDIRVGITTADDVEVLTGLNEGQIVLLPN
jgi:hypothetical protein